MDEAVGKWKQAGTLHLWRYKPEKSGLKGWHLKADEAGLGSAIGLVELLGSATYPAKRTLKLTKPSDRTVNCPFAPLGPRKVIAPGSLQIAVEDYNAGDLWELEEGGEQVKLRLGRQSLAELVNGLRELRAQGYGDFSVGPARGQRPHNIWLW